jgi:hypothetical protein
MSATFAKAKLNTGNFKGSNWWRSGIRPLKCLSCCYVLRYYINVTRIVRYKSWADRPGVYIDTLYLIYKMKKNNERKS